MRDQQQSSTKMAARICTLSLLFLILMVGNTHSAHFSYTPDDETYPCIIMDAKFSIRISAVRYSRVIASNMIESEDETIAITGSCGSTNAILNLGFSGSVMWSFIFGADEDTHIVKLGRLIQFVPRNIFAPYATNISDSLTFDDPSTVFISHTNQSYYCKTKQRTQYFPIKPVPGATTFSIETKIYHIRAQAFGVKHGRYSPYVLCHDDIANATTHPTTTTTTTAAPTEFAPTSAPDNTYYVTNAGNTTTCIVLTGRIDLDIRYKYKYNTTDGKVGTRTVTFPIPTNATWHGNCKLEDGTQNLIIDFFKPSWSLEFIFKKKHHINTTDPELLGQTQKKLDYGIHSIDLVYVIDHDKFPGSILSDGEKVRESSTGDEYPHKSKGKGYYSCSAENKMKLNKKVDLMTTAFKFKAFNENQDRKFEGSISKCYADENNDTRHAVIIVGCVLGAIILIVIIIVVITKCNRRRRRRRHYNTIKGR